MGRDTGLGRLRAAGVVDVGLGGADYSDRYPELGVLRRLPAGTVLDGELVRLEPSGVSELAAILSRHQLSNPARIRRASRDHPVCYVVFDLLYHRGQSLLGQPLRIRRAALQELLQGRSLPGVPARSSCWSAVSPCSKRGSNRNWPCGS